MSDYTLIEVDDDTLIYRRLMAARRPEVNTWSQPCHTLDPDALWDEA
jgi:hypothetical protein